MPLIGDKRFWKKVDITSGPIHEEHGRCWIWTAGRFTEGYGGFKRNGRTQKAHRVAWEFYNGPVPSGMLVLHKCDNPSCVRPSHLFLGTDQDNMDDKHAKGREKYEGPDNPAHGEQCHTAKLTEADVLAIRAEYQWNSIEHGTYALAERYGVYQSTIYAIVTGKSWKHLLEDTG